eukprot:358312-Chlamydomonas_euryale.AAC.4
MARNDQGAWRGAAWRGWVTLSTGSVPAPCTLNPKPLQPVRQDAAGGDCDPRTHRRRGISRVIAPQPLKL